MKIDWTVWKPRLAYGGFVLLAFLLALRWTFPSLAVKERLIVEAASRGWTIDVDDVGAGGLVGIRATGVKLSKESGLSVPIDDLTASLRLLPLLTGRLAVAFDARLYDGRIRGTADLRGEERRVAATVEGLDLGAVLPLRKASGVDLLGMLDGSADLTLPASTAGKPSGRIELEVKEAGIAGGQLPIPGMSTGLTLPRMGFGEVRAAVSLAEGKASFEKLEARGGDAELETEGLSVVVQPRMEFAPVFGKAKVKVKDAFWANSGTQGFKGLVDVALAQAKGRDGAWHFTLTGSAGHLRMQPLPGQ